MSDHTVYEATVRQVARLQDEHARISHGLRELKAEAASQSLRETNGDAARSAFARFEGHIEQLLAILGLALVLVLGVGGAAQAAPNAVALAQGGHGAQANAPAGSSLLAAPDVVYPFGISKLSGPLLFVENGAEMINYHYVANTPNTLSDGVDYHAAVTVRICTGRFIRVSGWDRWRKTADGYVVLDGLPIGMQEFSIVSRNGGPVAGQTDWTVDVDTTGLELSGSVAGIACGMPWRWRASGWPVVLAGAISGASSIGIIAPLLHYKDDHDAFLRILDHEDEK